MSKRIGIVACSAEGAALCYQTICLRAASKMGEHQHPEISMHTFPLARYMEAVRRGDWEGVGRLMHRSGVKLAAIGAEFLICPDNTIHQAFIDGDLNGPLPWMNISDVVAQVGREHGYRCLGVLGTKYLMEGPVYRTALEKVGLEMLIPDQADRLEIDRIIFSELVYGKITEPSREYFKQVIGQLQRRGCDAVVLGCTEIPLLVNSSSSPIPTLDSTRLLADEALSFALR
jgi:aspartate racemase